MSVLGPDRDIALLFTRTLRNQPTKQTNKDFIVTIPIRSPIALSFLKSEFALCEREVYYCAFCLRNSDGTVNDICNNGTRIDTYMLPLGETQFGVVLFKIKTVPNTGISTLCFLDAKTLTTSIEIKAAQETYYVLK